MEAAARDELARSFFTTGPEACHHGLAGLVCLASCVGRCDRGSHDQAMTDSRRLYLMRASAGSVWLEIQDVNTGNFVQLGDRPYFNGGFGGPAAAALKR